MIANATGRANAKPRSRPARWPWQTAVMTLLVMLGAIAMVIPLAWMLTTSLKPSGSMLSIPPEVIPRRLSAEGYVEVFTSFPILTVFGNSVLVTVLTTLGQLIVSSMSGYAFARFEFRGRNVLFLVYLATLMIPFTVTMTPLFIVVKTLGWTNTYAGLIVPVMFSAFGTFFMRQFFLSIPREYEEAATIDGASTVGTFVRIILPMAGPALATLGILSFMGSWNSFLWPLLIVSDQNLMTLPLALSTLQGIYPGQTQWNVIMAGAIITVLPMIAVFFAAQRWIIQGVAASGIKG